MGCNKLKVYLKSIISPLHYKNKTTLLSINSYKIFEMFKAINNTKKKTYKNLTE